MSPVDTPADVHVVAGDATAPTPDVTAAAVRIDAAVDDGPERTLANSTAYSDEPVVNELAGDPQWTFRRGDEDGEGVYGCSGDIRPQSCEPNPCHEGVGQRCRNGCEHSCQGLERTCRTTAATCLRPCVDEACRVACARVEARCLDDAIAAKDRCLTGVCGPRQAQCEEAQQRRFHDGPCRPACQRCAQRCEGNDNMGDCYRACFRRTPGCDPGQQSICVMIGPNYGAPEQPQ